MYKLCYTALILVLITLGNGCYNRIEINDTMASVAQGWDIDSSGQNIVFTGQFALPPQSSSDSSPPKPKVLMRTVVAPSPPMAARMMLLSLPRSPIWSFSDTIIIGEGIARKDIALFLDHISRNRVVRENSLLFLSYQCTPEEILNVKTPPEDYTGIALDKIMRGQEWQTGLYSPVTNIEFLNKVSSVGVEPVIPQVTIEDRAGQKILKISGLGVFRGHQMVGSLDENESLGYHFLRPDPVQGGLMLVTVPERAVSMAGNDQFTVKILRSMCRITPLVIDGKATMKIIIEAEGNLYEQPSLEDPDNLQADRQLEAQTALTIQQHAEACIQKAQSYQSDIIGWGMLIKQTDPGLWAGLAGDWPQHFATVPYQIQADFKIRRTYLADQNIEAR